MELGVEAAQAPPMVFFRVSLLGEGASIVTTQVGPFFLRIPTVVP